MENTKVGKSDRPKNITQILDEQIQMGLHEFKRSNTGLFISAFTAGLEIGFSIILMGTLYSIFQNDLEPEKLKLVVAMGYPLGFIFVIIGRSELFTEHTALAILPVLNKSVKWTELLILWGVVYLGNLTGGYIFGLLIAEITPQIGIVGPGTFEKMALDLIAYNSKTIFLSALLAGWMMGLLGWLITSAQETISRIFIVILITFTIGVVGLHHCIVGSVEVFTGLLSGTEIQVSDYLRFMLWATLGNAVGGAVFVAILKYSHVRI